MEKLCQSERERERERGMKEIGGRRNIKFPIIEYKIRSFYGIYLNIIILHNAVPIKHIIMEICFSQTISHYELNIFTHTHTQQQQQQQKNPRQFIDSFEHSKQREGFTQQFEVSQRTL